MKKGKARVAALEAPGKFAIREFEVPKVGEEDILLEVEMCTICGSDPPVYKGLYAGVQYPTVMGHELIGRIVEMGAKARDNYQLKVDDRVVPGGQDGCGSCRVCREGNGRLCQAKKYSHATRCTEFPHFLGGFGEYLYIRGGMHLHRVNEEVPAEAGCLGNNVGNGVYYTQIRGGVKKGDAVVISGVGGQGLGSVIGAKDVGARQVIAAGMSIDRFRFEFAKKLGADYTIDVEKEDPVEKVRAYTNGEMADVVVETSGHPRALQQALNYVRPTGTIVLVGINWTNLPSDGTFVNEMVHKTLNVYGALGPRKPAMERAAQIINSGKFPIEQFITHKFTLAQIGEAFHLFDQRKPECIKVGVEVWK
jgi:threonine dehydrogenase-like Zn-dependent dehydrogenase